MAEPGDRGVRFSPSALVSWAHRRVLGRGRLRLLAALGALLLAGLALTHSGISGRNLLEDLRRLAPGTLLLAFGLILLQMALQFVRLRVLLRGVDARRTIALARAFFAGQVLNALLPARAGDVVRVMGVAESRRARVPDAVGLVCADKTLEAMGIVLLALPLASQVDLALPWGPNTTLLVAAALGLVGMGARLWRSQWLRLRALGRRFIGGFGVLARPSLALPSLVIGVASWACEIVSLQVIAEAMGTPLPFVPAAVAILATNLAILIPLSPANLGTFELGMTLALVRFGVDPATAAAVSLVHHCLEILGVVSCYLALLQLKRRQPVGGAPSEQEGADRANEPMPVPIGSELEPHRRAGPPSCARARTQSCGRRDAD